MVNPAVEPPATGGDEADKIMLIMNRVTNHDNDTEIPVSSATQTAAKKYITELHGLKIICPIGTAKFTSLGLILYFSLHVFKSSVRDADEEAVVSPMKKVENALFQSLAGVHFIWMQVKAV